MCVSRFYNTNLQLLFPLFPFYSHTREMVFLFFSVSGFSIFILFLCFFSTSFVSKATNPKQSSVIVQGRWEGMYRNKALWSALCSCFFSTCVFKLPYQTMTCPPSYLNHSQSPHIPLRKNSLNTNLFSSVSSKLQAFQRSRAGFHQTPLSSSNFLLTSYFGFPQFFR